jgi:hypothetical protein
VFDSQALLRPADEARCRAKSAGQNGVGESGHS